MTLNNRSKQYLEKRGCIVDKTEHWNAFAKKRNDLFGVFDLLVLGTYELKGITGVQVTSKSNMAARIKKITDSEKANRWLECGGKITVHGWYKEKGRWQVKEVSL